MLIPQDQTRQPDDQNTLAKWGLDLFGGLLVIAFCIAAFFVLGVTFDKTDDTQQHQQTISPHN